jgi:hypothetical protein
VGAIEPENNYSPLEAVISRTAASTGLGKTLISMNFALKSEETSHATREEAQNNLCSWIYHTGGIT